MKSTVYYIYVLCFHFVFLVSEDHKKNSHKSKRFDSEEKKHVLCEDENKNDRVNKFYLPRLLLSKKFSGGPNIRVSMCLEVNPSSRTLVEFWS